MCKKHFFSIGRIFVVVFVLAFAVFFIMKSQNSHAEDVDNGGVNTEGNNKIVTLYIGSNKALVDDEEVLVDKDNPKISPYTKNGTTLVPVRFIAETLGAEVSWDNETKMSTIELGDVVIQVDLEGKQFIKTIAQPTECEMKNGRVFVPIRNISEAFSKEVFYDRGLIVISDKKNIYDAEKDKDKIDEIISRLSSLPLVGTKANFKELINNALEDNMKMYTSNVIEDGGFVEVTAEEVPSAITESNNDSVDDSSVSRNETAKQSEAVAAEAEEQSSGMVEGEDYSGTNVQVEGVDEPDIIKTDGEFIYYAKDNMLFIVKVNTDGSMELLNKMDLAKDTDDEYYSLDEILIEGNKLILIGNGNRYNESASSKRYYYYEDNSYTLVTVIDITDKKNTKTDREVELKGNYLQARRIGKYVYFISSTGIYPDMVPMYMDTALGNEYQDIDYTVMRYIPDCPISAMTTIAGINLDSPRQKADVYTFLGNSSDVYASSDNLYITATFYNYGLWREDSGRQTNTTDIYKFELNNGKVNYSAKGSVEGTLLNQFSMDENKGYFRVATTTEKYTNRQYTMSNNIIVLDETLNKVGEINDIAPGEKIYSARFMGDKAYVVTFEIVDPLFVIDLSDPKNPKILGALKIPGYSDYLHPYDENHLIGIGKDTVEYNDFGYYKGMKMSMFDVTDVNNPKEMFVEYIGDRGTTSEVLNNHKALLFSKDKNLLALPVELYEIPGTDESKKKAADDSVLEYGQFTFQGAYVYNVDLKEGFKLRGTITHLNEEDLLKSATYGGDYNKYIDRIIYIRDNLYTFSKTMIKSNDINSVKENGVLDLGSVK